MNDQKICRTCNTAKSFHRFGQNARTSDGLESTCKDCYAAVRREARRNKRDKHCYKCKQRLPIENFALKEGTRDSYDTICQGCRATLHHTTLRVRMKTCSRCKQSKRLERFPKNNLMLDGYDSTCKDCRAEVERQRRRQADPQLEQQEELRKERHRLRMRRYDPFQLMANAARTRAKHAHVPCEVNANLLLALWKEQNGVCPISKRPMDLAIAEGQGNRSPYKASLDRIIPEQGYVLGNIRLVCWQVNCMKHTATDAELLDWCQAIVAAHRKSA